jgi:secreted trypsin-like serine protease
MIMKFASVIVIVASLPPTPCVIAGTLEAAPRNLIIGGRLATSDDNFPWFSAGYGQFENSTGVYNSFCGGTLIHRDIVLTAAHCVSTEADSTSSFNVFASIGGIRAPSSFDRDLLDGDVVDVVCSETYPGYKDVAFGNDIALVKLARPSEKTLIKLNVDTAFPAMNQAVTAIGIGTSDDGNLSPTLKVLDTIFVQSVEACRRQMNYNESIHICTNDDDPSTTPCTGDSGGPIFIGSGENATQVGILSYGIPGCDPVDPVYWTNVAAYKTFITDGICRKCCRVVILS